MKKTLKIFALVLLPALAYSQTPAANQDLIPVLQKLFEASKTQDYNTAADYIVYRGDDTTREWNDKYDITVPAELNEVKRVCKKIKALLDLSTGFEFKESAVEEESEGVWYIQVVEFKSGNQNLSSAFAFLKINENFLLGDID